MKYSKQFKKIYVYLMILMFIWQPKNILSRTQNSYNNSEDIPKISISPQISEFKNGSFQLVFDYSGTKEIYTDDNKSLRILVDGKELIFKNISAQSNVDYKIETATFNRIPKFVHAHGIYVLTDDQIESIAASNNASITDIGELTNKSFNISKTDIDQFIDFKTKHISEIIHVTKPVPIKYDKYNFEDIGFTVSNLSEALKKVYEVNYGVFINKVRNNSKASKAGLTAAVIIIQINGRNVKDTLYLKNYIDLKKGSKISFTIKDKNGKIKFIMLN